MRLWTMSSVYYDTYQHDQVPGPGQIRVVNNQHPKWDRIKGRSRGGGGGGGPGNTWEKNLDPQNLGIYFYSGYKFPNRLSCKLGMLLVSWWHMMEVHLHHSEINDPHSCYVHRIPFWSPSICERGPLSPWVNRTRILKSLYTGRKTYKTHSILAHIYHKSLTELWFTFAERDIPHKSVFNTWKLSKKWPLG